LLLLPLLLAVRKKKLLWLLLLLTHLLLQLLPLLTHRLPSNSMTSNKKATFGWLFYWARHCVPGGVEGVQGGLT
jgi:hypothetical protein